MIQNGFRCTDFFVKLWCEPVGGMQFEPNDEQEEDVSKERKEYVFENRTYV